MLRKQGLIYIVRYIMSDTTNLSFEPIAIVGIGLRFPGGATQPEEFWRLLAEGTDCIVDVPADRWDMRRFYDPDSDRPGKTHQPQMGFLKLKLDEFDPLFFGMSPREAAILDPQQRLLLESTWEAFEDAGLTEKELKGSATGVFIGGFCLDNKMQQLGVLNRDLIGQHTATSSTMVMLSNRISYSFDLRGPSLTIDTACSSALVAAHYACMSIWTGESKMAIAGGVNVMLRPEYPIAMSKGQFLSKHARCKAFDEDAGGYVRGEGVGVVVFKPLSQAIADGDYIYACVRATGSNQDGATNGITVPNPDAQEALIREVYAKAGINASDIRYVEAHGTGTKAGDPVEITALNNVLCEGRGTNDKVFVGSVKTNIGHLEAAAGIAGIIKSALLVNKRLVPPHLHFKKANPKINFESLSLKVALKPEPFDNQDKLLASINSFGYGGTNGHMVLEEPPRDYLASFNTQEKEKENILRVFPISAKSDNALKSICKKYADYLKKNPVSLVDFAYTLAYRRTHHLNRVTIVAADRNELIEKLEAYAQGEMLTGVSFNQAQENNRLVFVFTGMGPQWWAMGRELYASEPVFKNTIDRCDKIFKDITGWSLLDEMMKPENESRMNETAVAQPANFFIQAALTDLWNSWGVKPHAVVGHSVGEVPAAYVSGALTLEEGVLVSYHRSRCQQTTAGQGTMLAIGLGEDAADKLIRDQKLENEISIAAINSFNGVTIAGTRNALEKISEVLTPQNIFNKMLTVEVAYHSYQMDPLHQELLHSLQSVAPQKATIPLYSTVTGTIMNGTEFDNNYWWQNVRQPVRFAKAAQTIVNDGYTLFLEVGPHPVLRTNINECLTAADKKGYTIPSLRRGDPELPTLLNSFGALHTLDVQVDWTPFTSGGKFIKIPTYAWDKEVYWQESLASVEDKMGVPGHVFMNNNMHMPYPAWEVEINRYFMPWMDDHKIEAMTVIPGAAYVEAGLALHEKEFSTQVCTLQNLEFNQVLVVDEKRIQMFHTSFNPQTNRYSVYSRFREDNSPWTLHASGRMLKDSISRKVPIVSFTDVRNRCSKQADAELFYTQLSERGLNYGPWFQGVKEIFKGQQEVLVKIEGHSSLIRNVDNYLLHPSILDSGFQSMVAIVGDTSQNPNPFVPVSIDEVVFYTSPLNECWCWCRITDVTSNTIKGDLMLFDDNGEVMVSLEGITCQAIQSNRNEEGDKMANCFYEYTWHELESLAANDHTQAAGKYMVFGDYDNIDLLQELNEKGIDFIIVTKGDAYSNDEGLISIRPNVEEDYDRLFAEVIPQHILYTWSLETSGLADDISMETAVDQTMPVVYMAKALSRIQIADKLRLIIVTRGVQVVVGDDKGISLETSAFWGLNHLIGNENPAISPKTIDLHQISEENEFKILVAEIISSSKEEDVAIRLQKRFGRMLSALSLNGQSGTETKRVSTDVPVSLEVAQIGRLDSLYYDEFERKESLAPDEIEIKNFAACLNLKDGLKVIGQLSEKATQGSYYERNIGHEAAGVITRVGSNVTDFKVGEEIILAAPEGCLRSYVVSVPTYYLRKPKHIAFEDALMVVPYMTVLYSLRNRAQLQKGEKILIHNGTGGVGLAAIQYAQYVGAEIFTTAGSEEKREYLRQLGIKNIYDSRSLEYVKQIKADTNGYGVDVVLNAIAGESLYQSFELLAAYGRFVEIGKRDITENTGLPMQQFNNNITFHGIDVDRLMMERPQVVQQIHRNIEKFYEDGVFKAVNTHLFNASDAVEAFNFMLQSKHIGKVVIQFQHQEVDVPVKSTGKTFEKNATYLITGGTGGFGLQIAKAFADKGAAQLVLASRSGAKSDEAKEAIRYMESKGVKVYAEPIDITNADAVAGIINKIQNEMPPLKGIIHGAVVLDDGFIVDMTHERFVTSYHAKVGGLLNVHKFTKKIPLDFFISFSSISALIGNAGQANYVSSNTFLDQFAHFRRANGMQASTINLGVLGEVGVAARDANVTAVLESGGIFGFTTREAIEGLMKVIETTPAQVGMFDVDWSRWSSINPKSAQSSRFRHLAETRGASAGAGSKLNEFAAELSIIADNERTVYVENAVAEQLANVLKLSVEKIDKSRGINFLGVDSLIAVELGRAISARFGVDVSTMELLSGPNVSQLASIVIEKVIQSGALMQDIDSLSEEQLDALLAEVKA